MSTATSDLRTGGERQVEQQTEQVAMLARAITALIDCEPDEEAIRYVRALSALQKPSENLAAFMQRLQDERRHGTGPIVSTELAERAERARRYAEKPPRQLA